MVGGAVVAGLTDLTFNFLGYAWVSVCVVSTAIYLILIKKLKDVTGAAGPWALKGLHAGVSPSSLAEIRPAALGVRGGSTHVHANGLGYR